MESGHSGLQAVLGDRYRIEREIGRGGMATVYLAHDRKTPRLVALKVLHRELTPFIGRERFLQEIRTIGSLSHPHILALYDWDEREGWLYYVSPFMPEGSLRDRLAAGGPLPLADALDLTAQVGAALQAAHEHHPHPIIHRDVKPGNILLSKHHALLADFGIARGMASATGQPTEDLTETGVRVGTPRYMSPEQERGATGLDPRSDQYSLATVLFEMLTGTTPTALIIEERREPMAFLRASRPELPGPVVTALERALAADRDARHPSVAHLLAALRAPDDAAPVVGRRADLPPAPPPAGDATVTARRRPLAILLAVGLALVAGGTVLSLPAVREGLGLSFPLDSTRYAVFPFVLDSGVPPLNERALVRDELGGWSGISLVDEGEEGEMMRQPGAAGLSIRDQVRIARRLGAGRVVLGAVSRSDDSLRIRAGLYDTRSEGRLLESKSLRVSGPGPAVGIALRELAQALLVPPSEEAAVGTPRSSRNLAARRDFEVGRGAIRDWDLARADSAFARAGRADAGFIEAALWLGLVRQWQRAEPARWRPSADQAGAGRDRLGPREQRMAAALQASAQGDGLQACRAWQELTVRDPGDHVSWFSSALCQMRDTVVVADQASPSGWRFRTSYHGGLQALYRAVRLAPVLLRSFRPGSSTELRRLLLVNANAVRLGRDPLSGADFVGRPAWSGDSFALIPYTTPMSQVEDHRRPGSADAAVAHQRDALREVTLLWSEAYPADESAMEALGVAMDLAGRREARDTLRRALSLASEPGDRLRVATTLVWLELKYALPDDPPGMRRARQLADSILMNLDPGVPGAPLAGAALALLTGRGARAATLFRHPQIAAAWSVDPTLAAAAPSLLAFAALGGPEDSIRRYANATALAISEFRFATERESARREWLARAATLASPIRLPGTDSIAAGQDLLFDAQSALARGDTVRTTRLLEQLMLPMRAIRPPERSLDVVVPEAALLLRLGRGTEAETWLAAPLDAFAAVPTDLFADPAIAASVGRAMATRIRLAAARGDTSTAKRWALPLQLLWSDADGFLRRAPGTATQ